jgi:hypothetical protein
MPRIAPPTLLLLAATAQAGAPMATEDADVLAPKECEWETVLERLKAGPAKVNGLSTGVQCHAFGSGPGSTQLGLAYSRAKEDGIRISGLSLGGKTALIPRDGDGFGLTLAWGFEALKLPGRSSYKHDATAANFVASHGMGALTLHGNLGWTRVKLADETIRAWALGASYEVSEGLELLAESYGAQRAKSAVGLGVRFSAGDWTFGAMAAQDRDSPKAKTLTLSAKLGF